MLRTGIFGNAEFAAAEPNLDRMIFGSCEYAKDGLLPLTELLGYSAWYERLLGITDSTLSRLRKKLE